MNDLQKYFSIKHIKAATVSEISEATASSPIPVSERVNFHIGNPVQEDKLVFAYLRSILGIDINKVEIDSLEKIYDELEANDNDKTKIEFLKTLIEKSGPYTPRGGFNKRNPNFLIKYFYDWLSKNQQEPLNYDLGEQSGKREVIISSGGISEALRMLFHALSKFLIFKPANIFLFNIELPEHITKYENIKFLQLDSGENNLISNLKSIFEKENNKPNFLIIGTLLKEETRRELRKLSLKFPIFFIETNNAQNHLSLAREAKMMNRVLRILTPKIFSESLKDLSITFIAGYSEFISIIETIHFQLKGTPSASEIELLTFILKNYNFFNSENKNYIEQEEEIYSDKFFDYKNYSALIDKHISKIKSQYENHFEILNNKSEYLEEKFPLDFYNGKTFSELIDDLIKNLDNKEWQTKLEKSFLLSFLQRHPEYKIENCFVASGSSRTALALLGFHCGINEVIFPDLSWTYEHCFPNVEVVPLTKNFGLDVKKTIDTVSQKIKDDSNWKNHGAVVFNNPHNATGNKFDEEELKYLLQWLLGKKIFVIDDLSYQNVTPTYYLERINTLRQLTNQLISTGYLSEEEGNYLITVHSVSKTDSLAGARLSVVEIRNKIIAQKFKEVSSSIKPNIAAIFLTYLFYRNDSRIVNSYWLLRNKIFKDRSDALLNAVENLPQTRNLFGIKIKPPRASMYPQLIIENLPDGLSLDWLAYGLARQGIGLVPLSTFARTEDGFDSGRKTFRLTLGGTDTAEILLAKTRRVIIDLNKNIAGEASQYKKKEFNTVNISTGKKKKEINLSMPIETAFQMINDNIKEIYKSVIDKNKFQLHSDKYFGEFSKTFLPERISIFENKFKEKIHLINDLYNIFTKDRSNKLEEVLEYEFSKDNLENRVTKFRKRLYDRTVHPTQMYSIKSEMLFEELFEKIVNNKLPDQNLFIKLQKELVKEYLGLNVSIVSSEEADELILDLKSLINAENYFLINTNHEYKSFLSFWGDWDGSNRPSGQGHRLVAAGLIENVNQQAKILRSLLKQNKTIKVDAKLIYEIENLNKTNEKFISLFNEINLLTHQLEKRYRGILPYNIEATLFRKIGMTLHIAKDPLTSLWYHNDRLERKMLELRNKRKETLEYYFSLNKKLRKTLYSLIPAIKENISNQQIMIEAGMYRDLLKRFIITPRIHQKLILAQDQFAIDTTVHNANEINEVSGKYGNPAMVLALQISMSTKAEALISLDRKLSAKRELILRENNEINLPQISTVPLFEDVDSVNNIENFLNKVWEYSLQSRRINQEIEERFNEIIYEVFIAGSDLSQQVSQAMAMQLFRKAKLNIYNWLAQHNLIGKIRIKMGSGEPMQRQGGYYSTFAGEKIFNQNKNSIDRFSRTLTQSTKRSTIYATTPLLGIFAGGDLRTFQSTISEKLRHISIEKYAQLIYHLKESQKFYEEEILKAGEPISETRLQFSTRGYKNLERLTIGNSDKIYDEFLLTFKKNFRQILYGNDVDVVGIHIISYFIGRTSPVLRDRPTVRPQQNDSGKIGHQILERIAGTIPFSKYGSLLRAIAHNQAQTVVLGINQLTTGLFRSIDEMMKKQFAEGNTSSLIIDRVLPKLPVYEILNTLRIYQDVDLVYLNKIEKAFPAGNSAFLALREDIDSIKKYLPLFQKELIRRHGVDVNDFFDKNEFIVDLLPTVRPDVAVLLQADFFNTDSEKLFSKINYSIDKNWQKEIDKYLSVPVTIKNWREKIWQLLETPVYQRVSSFVELAIALNSLSQNGYEKQNLFVNKKLSSIKAPKLSNYSDENMQQFLSAAVDYLSSLTQEMVEVPINIVRALKEAKQIIKIEEQALNKKEQDLLRFYLLQIARLTGENG
ncbi:pyridoxal phosphate-dependent aminotransferase [Stygiobacter electus]|uniref:Pyridoxal phosphate-dependent aminotransferase n=1 Tax=Stygiobacter electus TaxID=3032292 RepID=A0AAE3P384_9BACT|nr:pyridoxal phosphate-dependent aminotransferase [Stygiobacter electus]MDF1612085.1 pyridoxal phosphate-dependent aminotransferase [Stygiobacter electus]